MEAIKKPPIQLELPLSIRKNKGLNSTKKRIVVKDLMGSHQKRYRDYYSKVLEKDVPEEIHIIEVKSLSSTSAMIFYKNAFGHYERSKGVEEKVKRFPSGGKTKKYFQGYLRQDRRNKPRK